MVSMNLAVPLSVCFAAVMASDAMEASSASTRRLKEEHNGKKSKHPVTVLFEGDLQPNFQQILDSYGSDVIAELEELGILPTASKSTIIQVDHDNDIRSLFRHLWPRSKDDDVVRIPFVFDRDTFSKKKDQQLVLKAMKGLSDGSGVIRFVPYHPTKHESTTRPYLHILREKVYRMDVPGADYNCWSYVGCQYVPRQRINLGPGFCGSIVGGIQHELLHSLGFWHEQNRFDRDEHVTMQWDQVDPGLLYEYRKRLPTASDDYTLGKPYDLGSIMHDSPQDFALNETSNTMITPVPVGLLDAPSEGDLIHLRLLYQCQTGPRTYDDYMANPCTYDCACWEGAPFSCRGEDALCQRGLSCVNDRCARAIISKKETISLLSMELPLKGGSGTVDRSIVAVFVAAVTISIVVLLVSWLRKGSSKGPTTLCLLESTRKRNEYQPIP